MKYFIFLWNDASNNGTAPIWNGSDKRDYERMKKEMVKRYPPFKSITREAVYQNGYTIFSFAETARGYYGFIDMAYQRKPISVKYQKIKEE